MDEHRTPAGKTAADTIATLERLVAVDPGKRGITRLVQWGALEQAARVLLHAERVGILSGFYVPAGQAAETDGPLGAKAVADALAALGGTPLLVTDEWCAPVFQALDAERLHLWTPALLTDERLTHVLAIERVGRAADGRYYSMRGDDISAHTAPADELLLQAAAAGLPTLAVGDGGNEAGMAAVAAQVADDVPQGHRIACVVPAQHLVVAGVSNWGSYALVAALSVLAGRDLLPTDADQQRALDAIVAAGAVDGVTRRPEPTVDGMPFSESLAVLGQLRQVVEGFLVEG